MPAIQQWRGLMVELGHLGLQSTVPRQNPTSQCPLVKLGFLGPEWRGHQCRAVARPADEARPPGFVKYSVTSESNPDLAESFGEDSSSEKEERLLQLFRKLERERSLRMLDKLRERCLGQFLLRCDVEWV